VLGLKVLLINNYDSFVYNIYQMMIARGDSVDIRNNDDLPVDVYYSKVIISPGPGNPENASDSGNIMEFLEAGNYGTVLGICFGHQVIGKFLGSAVRPSRTLMHGEIDEILNLNAPLMKNLPEKFHAVRYHSLAITPSQKLKIDAISGRDGEIMAFHDYGLRYFGLQFHPESYYSEYGKEILENFMVI